MADALRDGNFVTTVLLESSSTAGLTLNAKGDQSTGALLVSVASANGDVVGPASSTDNALPRFDGTTGKLIQNSVTTISDTGVIVSNANSAAAPTAQTGALLQLNQANTTTNRLELDSYAASSFFTGVRKNGTGASPSQVLAGEQIGGFNGMGYTNTATVSGPVGSFRIYALENQTSSAQGGIATIAAIPSGSTTLADQLSVYGSTGVGIGLASATTVPTGGLEIAKNGAASFSNLMLSGTVFTGGTATTNFPAIFIQPSGTTAATTWSTSGTGLGMNLASGYAGSLVDLHINGGSSLFLINSTGLVTAGGWASSPIQSSNTFAGSNMSIANGATATSTGGSIPQTQIPGGTATNSRVIYRGSSSTVIGVGNSYGGVIFGDQGITEAASGVHTIIAAVAFKSNVNTNGSATTTDSTTVYIEGAPTGITPTNPATALWVAAGIARFDGTISSTGSITFTTASSGLILKQGANGRVGTFVANGATPVTVSNTSVAITDAIIISLNTVGGTGPVIQPFVATITAGVGFTTAANTGDTSTYNYVIIKNAA